MCDRLFEHCTPSKTNLTAIYRDKDGNQLTAREHHGKHDGEGISCELKNRPAPETHALDIPRADPGGPADLVNQLWETIKGRGQESHHVPTDSTAHSAAVAGAVKTDTRTAQHAPAHASASELSGVWEGNRTDNQLHMCGHGSPITHMSAGNYSYRRSSPVDSPAENAASRLEAAIDVQTKRFAVLARLSYESIHFATTALRYNQGA
ncbi:hypothetical protein Bbelb_256880 [Branchiostoma belcheri]|nr:hypothetical protein Bbelb_256880 [Branchiostoma belcheri]